MLEHMHQLEDLWGAVGVGWLHVHQAPENRPHVYVAWTDEEEVLYVGQSRRLRRRLHEHRRSSSWAQDPDLHFTWQRFATLDEAMSAEAVAIQELRPRHNKVRPHVLP